MFFSFLFFFWWQAAPTPTWTLGNDGRGKKEIVTDYFVGSVLRDRRPRAAQKRWENRTRACVTFISFPNTGGTIYLMNSSRRKKKSIKGFRGDGETLHLCNQNYLCKIDDSSFLPFPSLKDEMPFRGRHGASHVEAVSLALGGRNDSLPVDGGGASASVSPPRWLAPSLLKSCRTQVI